jgi:hypothetical protein
MGLALPLHCNSRIYLIELAYKFIYLHSLSSTVSDMYAIITLYSYLIPCMIRRVI